MTRGLRELIVKRGAWGTGNQKLAEEAVLSVKQAAPDPFTDCGTRGRRRRACGNCS